MKKAIVSACLLGEYCRYDGKTKKDNAVVEFLKDYEIIPFCPEAPLFGTPRERINILRIDGKNRVVAEKTNIDVTELLIDETKSFIEKFHEAELVVLKSKSPSCGIGTTPILDADKNILEYGNGVSAEIFLKKFKDAKITDESLY